MLQRPSKELKGLGIKDPLQNLTDSEIATINKTRSIDAKAKEEKDSSSTSESAAERKERKRREAEARKQLSKQKGPLEKKVAALEAKIAERINIVNQI